MPDDYLSEILLFAKPIAAALKKVIPCKRIGLSVVGLEVPHAHLHLLPLNSMADANVTREKLTLSPERMKEIQGKITAALAG